MLRGDKSVLVFLTGHEGMLLYFGNFGTDVSSSILAKQNNPSQLIIIILYASVLVFLTGVVECLDFWGMFRPFGNVQTFGMDV